MHGDHKFLGAGTLGERGQVAIPAEARRECQLEAGDKLIFFSIDNGMGLIALKAEKIGELLEKLTSRTREIEKILEEVQES